MSREVTFGWPDEYCGPREVLGPGYIPWAGAPRIIEDDDGRWTWTARPKFLDEQVFDDFMNLRDEGWQISIYSAGDRLHVAIKESEN